MTTSRTSPGANLETRFLTAYAALPVAVSAALTLAAGSAKGDLGDQWILPVDHTQGPGWTTHAGAGYNGSDAYEAAGFDDWWRIYWALAGNSVGTSRQPPTTAELYSIEWYRPSSGNTEWQPIESQFDGAGGETWPFDSRIPWAGSFGQNHQWILAQGSDGDPGTWVTTGPGPHVPTSASYNASDAGAYMWLKRGSWLFAKWQFGWSIDHTWSALRLTQRTAPPVIQTISRAGSTVYLTWTTDIGRNYQIQSATNLVNPIWENRGNSIPATGATLSKSDETGSEPLRFYRIVRLTQ